MSPIRARKAIPLGKFIRVNITARSIARALRGQGAPWSSISIGPRGFTWNSRRRTARVDLPGPFSYETPRVDPVRWTDDRGRRWEQGPNGTGGTTTRYLPDPVTDEEAEQQPCPRCGAEPDSPCRTRGTGRPTKPHLPRVELARLHRAYPDPDRQFTCEHGVPADTRCDLCDTPPWGTRPADPTGDDRP